MAGAAELEELRRLDRRAYAAALRNGLEPCETIFQLASADRMYDIVARGLPGRYAHWRFGRTFDQHRAHHDRGLSRVYELVLNTRPAQAYLLDGNTTVMQLLVIAHVYAHVDFFCRSRHFEVTDPAFLRRVRAAAGRIEQYAREHGRDRVEDLLDAGTALSPHRADGNAADHPPPGALGAAARRLRRPLPGRGGGAPEAVAGGARRLARARAAGAGGGPARLPRPRGAAARGLGARRARHLPRGGCVLRAAAADEDHQRGLGDLLARRDPAGPAAAGRPVRGVPAGDRAWSCSRTPGVVNPYNLGYALWRKVERVYTEPTDEDRERWPGAGEVPARERMMEISATYDDAAFIAEFLTEDVCEECKLFAWRRGASGELRVTSTEADEVRTRLVAERTAFGIPRLRITDADAFRSGGLWLEHRHEGVGLDQEYALGTLPYIARLWGRRVYVALRPRQRRAARVVRRRAGRPGDDDDHAARAGARLSRPACLDPAPAVWQPERAWDAPSSDARLAAAGAVSAMSMTGLRQVTTGLGLVQRTPPEAAVADRRAGGADVARPGAAGGDRARALGVRRGRRRGVRVSCPTGCAAAC